MPPPAKAFVSTLLSHLAAFPTNHITLKNSYFNSYYVPAPAEHPPCTMWVTAKLTSFCREHWGSERLGMTCPGHITRPWWDQDLN